jgi:hypothetical protein
MNSIDHNPDVIRIDTWRNSMTQVEHVTVPHTKIIQHTLDSTLDDFRSCVEYGWIKVALQCHLFTDRVPGNSE